MNEDVAARSLSGTRLWPDPSGHGWAPGGVEGDRPRKAAGSKRTPWPATIGPWPEGVLLRTVRDPMRSDDVAQRPVSGDDGRGLQSGLGPHETGGHDPRFGGSARDGLSVGPMGAERERDLVARAAVDAAAFGELYDHYLPRIYAFVMRRTADRAVAEDLTALTFEWALTALRGGRFRNESFGGWLHRVAANAIVDHARRQRRLVRFGASRDEGDRSTFDEPGDDRASATLAAALDRDELRRALLALPETHRRVLVLRFLDDLTVDELCSVLGCTRGALAVRLHRALRALRAALNGASTDAA